MTESGQPHAETNQVAAQEDDLLAEVETVRQLADFLSRRLGDLDAPDRLAMSQLPVTVYVDLGKHECYGTVTGAHFGVERDGSENLRLDAVGYVPPGLDEPLSLDIDGDDHRVRLADVLALHDGLIAQVYEHAARLRGMRRHGVLAGQEYGGEMYRLTAGVRRANDEIARALADDALGRTRPPQ